MLAPTLALALATSYEVPIVFTGDQQGIYAGSTTWNEPNMLFGEAPVDGVHASRLAIDPDVLRHGRAYLWRADGRLTTTAARAAFAGRGLALAGPPREVPALDSDYTTVIQAPGDEPAGWLVPWLAKQDAAAGTYPDVHVASGKLWPVHGADGSVLWLFAADGRLPEAAALRDPLRWLWASAAVMDFARAGRPGQARLFGHRLGMAARDVVARRWRARTPGPRVDTGNLVETLDTPYAEATIDETLAAIPGMRLDALVPYENELALPRPRLERLAKAAPLVAANLTAPPGIALAPYRLVTAGHLRVALVGLADTAWLAERGLLGSPGGWQGEAPLPALERALAAAQLDGADLVVVVTNMARERLEPLRTDPRLAAVITRQGQGSDWTYQTYERTAVRADAANAREPAPLLLAGVNRLQVGQLVLTARRVAGRPNPVVVAVRERVTTPAERDADDPDPARGWRVHELNRQIREHTEAVLPEFREVALRHPEVAKLGGSASTQFQRPQWSALAAGFLRRAAGAEVAAVPPLAGGSILHGEVPRTIALQWLPSEPVAIATLTGAQLAALAARPADRPLTFAGFDPAARLVGGRPLVESERYTVATTQALARGSAYAEIFADGAHTDLVLRGTGLADAPRGLPGHVALRDVTLAALDALKARHGRFDDAFIDAVAAAMLDDGHALAPRWVVAVKDAQGSLSRFGGANRASFTQVANSHVNKEDSTLAGFGGKASVTYSSDVLDWENKLESRYQRADFPGGNSPAKKLDDDLGLTTELRARLFKLTARDRSWDLTPYTNASYLTEFTPTPRDDGGENPRRQEIDGAAGIVLGPLGPFQELRLGTLLKDDLARPTGGYQPGLQLGTKIEQPVGPLTLAAQADLRHFFPTAEDTPADLANLAQLSAEVKLPVWGGLGLALGCDLYLFNGKLPATQAFGASLAPRLGLTFDGSFKP